MRLLTQIRKLEAKRAQDAKDAADAKSLLYVTNFDLRKKVNGAELRPGEEIAVDVFITSTPLWSRNFVFLQGVQIERITTDPDDYGRVLDARSLDAHHDFTEPHLPLPELGRCNARGRIEPTDVQFWEGAQRVRDRRPAKVKRSGSAGNR